MVVVERKTFVVATVVGSAMLLLLPPLLLQWCWSPVVVSRFDLERENGVELDSARCFPDGNRRH